MLAQRGRGTAERAGRLRKLDGDAYVADAPRRRMLRLHDHIPRAKLEILPRLGLGAALSWVVFLHVESIGMIIMTMMKEKWQSEAREARAEAREARAEAREARLEAREAREAQSREAQAREAQAQETIRDLRRQLREARGEGANDEGRRLDNGRPRDSRCPRERLSHAQNTARRSRYATAPDARNLNMRSSETPSSRKTSSVCSPSAGAGRRNAPGVSDSLTGDAYVADASRRRMLRLHDHIPRAKLEILPRLGLGAALSWVVFLHVEAIGMIIMTLMKEKLQSEAEARVRERMGAEMEARIVARLEAREARAEAREAQALAREALAQETIRDLRRQLREARGEDMNGGEDV